MKTLYKISNGLGDYYVIANDPTEANNKLKEVLDAGQGYGFSSNRKTKSIIPVAEEIEKSSSTMSPYDLTERYLLT